MSEPGNGDGAVPEAESTGMPQGESGEAQPTDAADRGAEGDVERESLDPENPDTQTTRTKSEPPPTDPLADCKAEVARVRDQLLRTAADFENYRRRSRRDADDALKKGAEDLLRTLLPVFDNLERAVLHADQAADARAIADGVRMVLKQFRDSLERVGIKRVPSVGSPFDPVIHEAIQQVESAEAAAGTVIAEVQPGYQFGDKLVRAAMVVVAKPPSPPPPPDGDADGSAALN